MTLPANYRSMGVLQRKLLAALEQHPAFFLSDLLPRTRVGYECERKQVPRLSV
jgi:hypothetical protein